MLLPDTDMLPPLCARPCLTLSEARDSAASGLRAPAGSSTTRGDAFLPASANYEAVGDSALTNVGLMGANELVLVVDDEEPIRTMTRRFLEQYGYRVVVAANGREALAIVEARANEVQVLLTDVMMPVMGGVALIRAVREIAPTIKVIATSGLNEPERTQELAALGVNKVQPKPCDPL
eukprot:gene42659-52124_t